MKLISKKRSYVIAMSEDLTMRTIAHCKTLSMEELQEYIDSNFRKANRLGHSRKSGAWYEGRMFKEKAKVAIIEMEKRRYG
jgi:predicted transcriptional regulator